MENKKHIMEVTELTIGYKNKTIGSAVNFNLTEGELCAIIGINGIGKSTLLRTLANLQPKLGGDLVLNELELEGYSQNDVARTVSVVLTESLASKNLSVAELIALGRQPFTNWLGRLSSKDNTVIQNSLETLQLEALRARKCFELSDGQLQRALIARAMAQDTPLILLDEPTTHLDLHHKVQILKLLKTLVTTHKKTIVFTSHEIELALQLCDKVLILNGIDNPFGKPAELINDKHLERLFPTDFIKFDEVSRTFKVYE